jgi:Fe-S cluster assembly protein SufB
MKQIVKVLKANKKEIIDINLEKEPKTEIMVFFIGKNREKFNLETTIKHTFPKTGSSVSVKGILFGSSKAQLRGIVKTIDTAPYSQVNLEQAVRLIGDGSCAEIEPELEIKGNKTQAIHSSTCGRFSKEQLLYLMSRGFSETQASEVLVMGFLEPSLEKIQDKKLRKQTKQTNNAKNQE